MTLTNINYKGYTIQLRTDIKSHCAGILLNGTLLKMVAGSINLDGTTDRVQKAKYFIDYMTK